MTIILHKGDCRDVLLTMEDQSVHCCVTSPPYFGLRDYGHAGQIGLEPTPAAFVAEMVAVFREVRRVMRDDGTLWLNLGDSYNAYNGNRGVSPSLDRARDEATMVRPRLATGAGLTVPRLKNKDLIGIPWRVAFALQADGWYLRQDIIWSKPNPMPESVTDRCTKAHEYIFLLSKSARYHYDAKSIFEPFSAPPKAPGGFAPEKAIGPMARSNGHSQWEKHRTVEASYPNEGRNKRSVWEVATSPFKEAHFATFPPELIEPCIKAGCPKAGTVLDPFGGAGTTGLVADRLGRSAILIELNPEYASIAERRLQSDAGMFAEVSMLGE